MFDIIRSAAFTEWLNKLKDRHARMRVLARLDRAAMGNLGDVQPVGNGVSEMRIHYGPGYRLYYMQRGRQILVMLCAGDKSTQSKDIENAKAIATTWQELENHE